MASAAALALPEPLLRRLWQRMSEIYGHRWVSSYGDDAGASPGRTWASGLAGLDAPQIARGLSGCMASAEAWPPSLPEFRRLCLAIPTDAEVMLDLRRSHAERAPFTRLVWNKLNAFEFARASQRDAERKVRAAYQLAVAHVMAGGEIPPNPPVQLTADLQRPPKPADPEVAKAHIAEIAERLAC